MVHGEGRQPRIRRDLAQFAAPASSTAKVSRASISRLSGKASGRAGVDQGQVGDGLTASPAPPPSASRRCPCASRVRKPEMSTSTDPSGAVATTSRPRRSSRRRRRAPPPVRPAAPFGARYFGFSNSASDPLADPAEGQDVGRADLGPVQPCHRRADAGPQRRMVDDPRHHAVGAGRRQLHQHPPASCVDEERAAARPAASGRRWSGHRWRGRIGGEGGGPQPTAPARWREPSPSSQTRTPCRPSDAQRDKGGDWQRSHRRSSVAGNEA